MGTTPRKKSPRAPSLTLEDAVERALKIYAQEDRHAAPTDAIAKDLGYSSAKNGAALSVLASLRYYGLVTRPKDGFLAVSEEVEQYKFAPDEGLKNRLLRKWLTTPPIFSDLLKTYSGSLPSDQTLRFDLIQKGFLQSSVDQTLSVFRTSVEFVGYFNNRECDMEDESNESNEIPLTQPNTETPEKWEGQPSTTPNAHFSVRIVGPGMNSTIEVADADDLDIVDVMINKLRKKFTENKDEK